MSNNLFRSLALVSAVFAAWLLPSEALLSPILVLLIVVSLVIMWFAGYVVYRLFQGQR